MSSLPEDLTQSLGRVRSRVKRAVRDRVVTVRERDREQQIRAQADDLAFGAGYLVRPAVGPRPRLVARWRTRTVAGYDYHARARITIGQAATGGTVVLIGRPVDVDTRTTTTQVIADRLAALTVGGRDAGTGAVVRAAAYLGGRWTLFLHGLDGSLRVLTDALASQQVWYTRDGSVIASYASLAPGSRALPPNSLLQIDADGAVSTHRYWPWPHQEQRDTPAAAGRSDDLDAAYAEFRERIVAHTRLLCDLGRPGVGLTAGPRSRAILAAYLPHRRDGGYGFTHYATESFRTDPAAAEDLFTASALAHRLDLPHRVLRAVKPPRGAVFELAYRRTYPGGTTLARAFARHTLPRDTVELHSAGADVVDQHSWEHLTGDFREGDLAHRVMLPFNDRRLLEMMLRLPPRARADQVLLRRLAAEVDDT